MKTIFLACSAFLVLGVFDMPSGYLLFLRIIITTGSVFAIKKVWNNKLNPWILIFGIIAILYNPIVPVLIPADTFWKITGIACSAVFLINALELKR